MSDEWVGGIAFVFNTYCKTKNLTVSTHRIVFDMSNRNNTPLTAIIANRVASRIFSKQRQSAIAWMAVRDYFDVSGQPLFHATEYNNIKSILNQGLLTDADTAISTDSNSVTRSMQVAVEQRSTYEINLVLDGREIRRDFEIVPYKAFDSHDEMEERIMDDVPPDYIKGILYKSRSNYMDYKYLDALHNFTDIPLIVWEPVEQMWLPYEQLEEKSELVAS